MPWPPILSLFHININSLDIQGNPLLNITGNGASFISQSNSHHSQSDPMHRAPGHEIRYPSSAVPALRRVEAQIRIRRKLEEACAQQGSTYGIVNVAQAATNILSLIEGAPASGFSNSLIDLAMNAHAMAYIALISFLYGFDGNRRRKIKKKSVQNLRRLLDSVYTLLLEEVSQKGIYTRIRCIFNKSRRYDQVLRMQEELLEILRDIESDEDANILKSLTVALDCPYQ